MVSFHLQFVTVEGRSQDFQFFTPDGSSICYQLYCVNVGDITKTSERNSKKEKAERTTEHKEQEKRRTQPLLPWTMKELLRGIYYASVCISRKIQDKCTESSGSGSKTGPRGREFLTFNVPDPKESSLAAIKLICTHTRKVSFQSETILSCQWASQDAKCQAK